MEELRAQLNELRESLEKETLSKVDLQNQNQSLKEELSFKKKVYEEVCGRCLLFVYGGGFYLHTQHFVTY